MVYSRMKTLMSLAILMIFSMVSVPAFGEGNIGFTFNQVIDDRSGGLIGDYEREWELFDFEIDGQLQFGDVYRVKLHTAVVFDLGSVGIKPFLDLNSKGYILSELGYEQNAGLALTVPYRDLRFDVGFFGSNAGPWGSPNALDELVVKGYNETQLEALGLGDVHPAPRGIPARVGQKFNAIAKTTFEKGDFEIGLKAIFELLGEGDKAQQYFARFQTGREIQGIDVNVVAELGFMRLKGNIFNENAFFVTFGKRFK